MERLGATENNSCINILCNQFLLFLAMQQVCSGSMVGFFLYLTFFSGMCVCMCLCVKGYLGLHPPQNAAEYPGVT